MDKCIGVAFELCAAFVTGFIGSAECAAAIGPRVLYFAKADVALGICESRADGVFAIGGFGTINAASGKQGCKLGDCQAKKLFGKDVVDSLLTVRDGIFQSLVQPLSNLTQENSGFTSRVKEGDRFIAPQAFWQEIQHLVHQFWRGKDLITAEICKAGKHIGVVGSI